MPSLQSLQERHRKNKYTMLSAKYGSGEYKIAELNCAIIAVQIKERPVQIKERRVCKAEQLPNLPERWPRF